MAASVLESDSPMAVDQVGEKQTHSEIVRYFSELSAVFLL